jgi:GNAT superfamily N-acetyltransferase
MIEISYASESDCTFWLGLDRHIAESELRIKMANHRCYLIKKDSLAIGVMRYNLFWDSIPFLTMIYLIDSFRGKGYGKEALLCWENEMRSLGHRLVMTSAQADEKAQFFYRSLGYKDTGCLMLDTSSLRQPLETFYIKEL